MIHLKYPWFLSLVAAVMVAFASCDSRPPQGSAPPQGSTTAPASPSASDAPPAIYKDRSVVLITVDTTRADSLQPYGATNVETPFLQELASKGVVFEKAWAVSPITLVSHASILTGLYPFEHGVRNNGIQYVSDSVLTLTEILRENGYRTAAFVSAAVLDRRYGLDQGFEIYDDDLSKRRNISARMVADRPADVAVDAAAAWLDGLENNEKYFVWLHLYDPHASYSPPPPFRDEYRDRLYEGEIAFMDQEIGRFLQHPRIRAEGEDQPIVTVIGDHGESLGEHGERTHAILAYNSTLHVPWILQLPGGPTGRRVKEPVGQVDLAPTLLSYLGLTGSVDAAPLPGRDLRSLIERRIGKPDHPYYAETYLPFYTYGWAKLRVIYQGRWKFIDAPEPELYDLHRDARELTNQFDMQEGVSHDLNRDLDEWLAGHDADHEAELSVDSEALAQLRSLGYVGVGSGAREEGDENETRPNPMRMIEQHVWLERARMFLADRLYDQAERQLRNVLKKDPGNLGAMIDMVRAKEGQGKIEDAIRFAEEALSLDSEYSHTYMILARLEARRNNFEKAVELCDIAIGQDPVNPELRVQKAVFLNRLGRDEAVEQVLEETLREHPDHPRANAVYANLVETRKGNPDAAEARLKSALERDPFLSQGWLFLGRVQEKLMRPEDALQSYRQGLVSRPDDADLHGVMGHLLARLGRHARAIAQLREAIRLSPRRRTELHVSLGAMLAEIGRLEEARREYEKALDLNPRHPGARNNQAIALYRSGRAGEARGMLLELVEEFPRHVDAHNNLAAISVDEGQWADAIRYSRQTIELSPNIVEAWNNLAIGLEETGKHEEALENYHQALKLNREYWPAHFNLGLLLKKMGRAEEALASFNEVLLRVPNHAETHLELGEIFAAPPADRKRAKIHWNAFLKHGRRHPRYEEIRDRLAVL